MKFDFMRPQSGDGDWPRGYWHFSFMAGPLQLRIGNAQFAVWWHKGNYEFLTVFNFLYGHFKPAP